MYLTKTREITRVGFVSTRFQGTDGVSLETWKWNEVLTELGYETFFFSGMSDWFPERSMVVITHYQRLLEYIVPDKVHVLSHGRIARSGGKELALELEEGGYAAYGADARRCLTRPEAAILTHRP